MMVACVASCTPLILSCYAVLLPLLVLQNLLTEVLTLLVGGRLGDIAVIDIRMQRVSHSWIAHESYKIQSLAQDDDGNLISVGSDSTVRFWSTINYSLRRTWANVHSRKNILVFFCLIELLMLKGYLNQMDQC